MTRREKAENIEANVRCAIRQFGGEMAIFQNGETEWVSTLKAEFGDNYADYEENAIMVVIGSDDYKAVDKYDGIIGRILSILD